jgi:hypothetical protein
MLLLPMTATAQAVADPFSFRGVPLQASEARLLRTLPEFACGPAHRDDRWRADRVCWPSDDGGLWYGNLQARHLWAEFIQDALCSVRIRFSARSGEVEEVANAMTRHLGYPKWVLEHYADGREALAGGHDDRRSPVVSYSWKWDGPRSYVRMIERGLEPRSGRLDRRNGSALDIEYSTEACDEVREQRQRNGSPRQAPRRQM